MFNTRIGVIYTTLAAIVACALTAACGGGGGGGGGALNPPPPPGPSPTVSPGFTDTMEVASGGTYNSPTYNAASMAKVVFSCGCSAQAGTTNADGSGSFSVSPDSTATPASPSPTYTVVPGRNYIAVATNASGGEAWTIQFAGLNPSRNHYLNGGTSDIYTAAVALYVFNNSSVGSTAFDDWNFNALATWYNTLKNSPNAQEQNLLTDIISRSAGNLTLYPAAPSWDKGHAFSGLIASDLAAVKTSSDSTIPQPCPSSGCTNTPTP